jgi:hypothetical protein
MTRTETGRVQGAEANGVQKIRVVEASVGENALRTTGALQKYPPMGMRGIQQKLQFLPESKELNSNSS